MLLALLAAQVVVVDAAGGGAFTDLPPAVAAAAPGDVLLVKSGSYSGFTLDRAITITADDGAIAVVDSATSLTQIDGRAVLHGLRFDAPLTVASSTGTIWLEDLDVEPIDFGAAALTVRSSPSVTLTGSRLKGGRGFTFLITTIPPGAGLDAVDSAIDAHDSEITGGKGYGALDGASGMPGSAGGAGARLDDSVAIAGGVRIEGGTGGGGVSTTKPCGRPGPGGPGVEFLGTASVVHLVDSAILGGPGGTDSTSFGFCSGATAPPGPETVGSGTVNVLLATGHLALAATSPVREGAAVVLDLEGPALMPAFVGIGFDATNLFLPALKGSVLIAPPYLVFAAGTLDAAGTLQVSIPTPSLPPALQAQEVFGQAGYAQPSGQIVLGEPAAVVILDGAF